MNDEPLYRNKEWLYNQFIIQGKECVEIAKENGWTSRVIQKTVSESKKLNEMILRNIPNELDVIQRKIFKNGDTDVE